MAFSGVWIHEHARGRADNKFALRNNYPTARSIQWSLSRPSVCKKVSLMSICFSQRGVVGIDTPRRRQENCCMAVAVALKAHPAGDLPRDLIGKSFVPASTSIGVTHRVSPAPPCVVVVGWPFIDIQSKICVHVLGKGVL